MRTPLTLLRNWAYPLAVLSFAFALWLLAHLEVVLLAFLLVLPAILIGVAWIGDLVRYGAAFGSPLVYLVAGLAYGPIVFLPLVALRFNRPRLAFWGQLALISAHVLVIVISISAHVLFIVISMLVT